MGRAVLARAEESTLEVRKACNVEATFSAPGARTITLTGTDSGALKDTDTVSISVTVPPSNSPPDVQILVPDLNDMFDHDAKVPLQGKVTDLDGPTTVSYEWLVQPVGGTSLVGEVPEISIGSGTASSGQVFTTLWTPNAHVIGSPGVVEVRILLRGTDSDGTITKTVVMSVMSPPA